MKMDSKVVEQLRKLLPEELIHQAWIAGGYAHNPELAGDIDVWVVGQEDMDAAEETIREHLIDHTYLVRGAPLSQAEARRSGDPLYDEHPHGFRVVANLAIQEPVEDTFVAASRLRPVQLLVTKRPDVDSLLEHFDITTHRIAYPLRDTKTFRVGQGYFPIGAQPRVMRFDTPDQTLQRLEKISLRYGFTPHPEDVAELERLKQAKFQEAA